MIRTLLKLALPIAAAALLDNYCRRRDLQRQRIERKRDLQVWEGEGGSPAPAALPARQSC